MGWLCKLVCPDYKLMKELREIDKEKLELYRKHDEQSRKNYNELHDFMMSTLIKVLDKENKGGTE